MSPLRSLRPLLSETRVIGKMPVGGATSESGSKGGGMGFGHEKLDVYRAAIEYVGWGYRFCGALSAAENADYSR